MNKNKIGSIFLISVLALAGIGISYAGFTDIITVFGTVDTGTVEMNVEDYSGTLVWKIWDCPVGTPPIYPGLEIDCVNEIAIYRGFNLDTAFADISTLLQAWCNSEYIAFARANDGDGTDYDVSMIWSNLFPCIDFTADVIIHYTGSIPVHVTVGDIVWDSGYDFSAYTTWAAYHYTKENEVWIKGDPVEFPVQMHYCEYIGIEATIHLEQDNTLQGLSGEFSFDINALQWNDQCDIKSGTIQIIKKTIPADGTGFGFTVTDPDGNVIHTETLDDGGSFTLTGLTPGGFYTISESNIPDDWRLWSIGVEEDVLEDSVLTGGAAFLSLQPEETIIVTFTNEWVDPSLVGHWKLDDGSGSMATDSSGNNNHGTLMPASPVWTTEGIINGALEFDGVDDYVEVPDSPSLDITDEITLMAWVYPESWDSTYENGILTKAGDGNWGVWNLHYKWEQIQHSGFRFEANIGGSTENIFEINPSEDLDKWYHVAGVYDGSEMKLFINGELVNSKPVTGLIGTNNQPLRLGKQYWWSTHYSMWDGKIDEVKIYNRALSNTEILNEYCSATTITINEPGPQYDNNQYGYNFDYSGANVEFTYCNKDSNLRGTITATGLKPYCTYQVKLLGIPTCQDATGDDTANEYIGYKGRWTCVSCSCSGAACNRNDAQYLANSPYRGDGSECIAGYLVFDFFTADENGDATKFIEAETSYHVLFAGGGTCNSNNNDFLYYPDASHPALAFCPPDKVNGQPESGRGGCGGLTLDSDNYHCTIALTEESFHQGNWATVLEGLIDFKIV